MFPCPCPGPLASFLFSCVSACNCVGAFVRVCVWACGRLCVWASVRVGVCARLCVCVLVCPCFACAAPCCSRGLGSIIPGVSRPQVPLQCFACVLGAAPARNRSCSKPLQIETAHARNRSRSETAPDRNRSRQLETAPARNSSLHASQPLSPTRALFGVRQNSQRNKQPARRS